MAAVTDLILIALATAAISVTISKTYLTDSLREWLWSKPKLTVWAHLADCPYCISHWVALVAVGISYHFNSLYGYTMQVFAVIAVSAIVIGLIMKLMGWDQREYDRLHKQLEEMTAVLEKLS